MSRAGKRPTMDVDVRINYAAFAKMFAVAFAGGALGALAGGTLLSLLLKSVS